MTTHDDSPSEPQYERSNYITDIEDLLSFLQISPDTFHYSSVAAEKFPLRVPVGYASRIRKNDVGDPLLRQVLPLPEEVAVRDGYGCDPVGDLDAVAAPGVLHKYHGRALFIVTGGCAINCRYCFRREFPYSDLQMSRKNEESAIGYIKTNPEINEVILSGGDPLVLSNLRIDSLMKKLGEIEHLKRIRIHSRVPVVLPERIDETLIGLLTQTDKQIIMVMHCNHSAEISQKVRAASALMSANRITLLNQSVLLKGVNDNVEHLRELSEQLFSAGILPYYLHLLDKVAGAHHFDVDEQSAVSLLKEIKKILPGYLVPRLVKEHAGALSKLSIAT
ncbi:MAG: EF-P beta-lysylation protein EpmB [Gammaproteobacteria bacterium]